MSAYTMSLRHIIDNIDNISNIEETGREVVEGWFSDYELSDYLTPSQVQTINDYGVFTKEKLAKLIVDHFYMREIGYETPKLFEVMVRAKMRELMGYYAELIYSASIDYDMLVNVNFTETMNRDISNNGSSNSSSNASGLAVNSDTPQGQINKTDILSGRYATSTTASESEGTSTDTAQSTGKENWTKTKKGNDGVLATAQKMIEQYRNNIRNINYEIIKDLNEMFIGLF